MTRWVGADEAKCNRCLFSSINKKINTQNKRAALECRACFSCVKMTEPKRNRSHLPPHTQRRAAARPPANSSQSSRTQTRTMWFQAAERPLWSPPLLVPACPVTQGERGPLRSAQLSSPRCASAPVSRERKKLKVSQGRTQTTWHSSVASRYFVPPANTLLLNLCLHTRRASGKGSHPPCILKETRSPDRCALMCCAARELKWCVDFHSQQRGGGGSHFYLFTCGCF